jgi:hypothetical protein
MIALDHRRYGDMRILADTVRDTPAEARPFLAAGILSHDLMRVQWWLRLIVALRSRRASVKRTYLYWLLIKRIPAIVDPLIEATAKHITDGKDRVDPASVGGFNAVEVRTMLGMLAALEVTA